MIALNKEQEAAVTAPDGPALVLAGAGSGKTRVIIERLAWLIEERGIDPRRLLALTFTNKAANEMQQRVAERLQLDRVGLWVGTFHSFGLYVLRREIERLGRPSSFTIFDDADQMSLMKRLIQDLPAGLEKVLPRDALAFISALKQRVEAPPPDEQPKNESERSLRELWSRYHGALSRARAVDFDDLLVLPARLFQESAEARQKYQRRFQYVLVDEYQDTNRAQYVLARLLSEAHGNIFAVGDEDQSIYSWRGADINNILDFANDFAEAKVYRLEQNYRSTKAILDAANALVAHNANRLGKNLWTAHEGGARVRVFAAQVADEEAQFVVDDLRQRGLAPEQVAVLYRTNGQSRLFEEACRLQGINYVVVGGIKFYSRKEVKDIVAYLRLLVNQDDDESLRRVLNVPPRGIGGVTLQHLEQYAALRNSALFQVLRDVETDETLSARARQAALGFVRLVDDLALKARESKVAPLVEALLEKIGYREYVRQSDEKDFRSRLEVVEEFLSACEQHDARGGGPLLQFLQDMALISDVDSLVAGAPAVTLMTCHSAKGLEYDHVYLAGLEEGLLPFFSEFDDDRDIEEERRLCYVAMTRARQSLTLTAARARVLYGRHNPARQLSRFLQEIGLERLEIVGEKEPKHRKAPPEQAPAQPIQALRQGTRVRHASFGPGSVLYTSGSGDKLRARIRFNTGRTVTLMVNQAPIEILEGKQR
ncbi:MAG: UvrD-helicase domain-containing protein [Candidatus Hydrogenedentes bacterium]|nr:UvrD-helicase domain-containing protein [Candidatus Hydrogenedentota bacterium]